MIPIVAITTGPRVVSERCLKVGESVAERVNQNPAGPNHGTPVAKLQTEFAGHDDGSRGQAPQLATDGTRNGVAQPAGTLTVQTRHDADAVVVALAGELDLAVAESVRVAISRAMGDPRQRVIVDLSELTFIDSSGLHTILDAYKHCRCAGPVLTIRPGPPNVQQVFELTHTLDLLPFETGR